MAINLGQYLAQKISYSLLHPSSHNWLNRLSQNHYTITNIKQMISYKCEHVNLIACVIDVKVQGAVVNFIKKVNEV
jgi:hypothetical protein